MASVTTPCSSASAPISLPPTRGLRVARPGFVLLAHPNGGLGKRFGVTVTKKIGNAVVRNRMKRRFRELLRAALPEAGPARSRPRADRPRRRDRARFRELREELAAALRPRRRGQGRQAAAAAQAMKHVLILARARLAARPVAHPAADLPLPAELQPVRDRGARKARRDQGWMDGAEAANALPPVGGTRLRPGALNRLAGYISLRIATWTTSATSSSPSCCASRCCSASTW